MYSFINGFIKEANSPSEILDSLDRQRAAKPQGLRAIEYRVRPHEFGNKNMVKNQIHGNMGWIKNTDVESAEK